MSEGWKHQGRLPLERIALTDGEGRPVRPRQPEEAWLPGLGEPVPDHPHFPRLVEAIRTIREREAWSPGRRATVPAAPRPEARPRRPEWSPLAILLFGAGLGVLSASLVASGSADGPPVDRQEPVTLDTPAQAVRAPTALKVEFLGAGDAQAREAVFEVEHAAGVEVVKLPMPAPPMPAPQKPAPLPAAAVDHSVARAFYELGQRQQAAGDVEAALRSYKRSAILAPDEAQTFYDWGWLLQERGDLPGAIDKYRATLAREPRHPFAYYNMGYLMQSAGDVTGAQIVYEDAIAAGADTAMTRYNLGWLTQKAGDEATAMEHYEAALRADPGHALAHYNLGYLLERQDERERAVEHYQAALASDPELSTARERLRELEPNALAAK